MSIARMGLSPRVRGNRQQGGAGGRKARSIPACAGEPAQGCAHCRLVAVYPRVCGGTSASSSPMPECEGLSPRVRGNLPLAQPLQRCRGSIPACAGEPTTFGTGIAAPPVYPRVCGGTWPTRVPPFPGSGLSPRVRGNLYEPRRCYALGGSIPACAGEPRRHQGGGGCGEVYPRVCGGTTPAPAEGRRVEGLSPRVRGNPAVPVRQRSDRGSIPACAGEPPDPLVISAWDEVYPRVCGGTSSGGRAGGRAQGLSPRVRGNP